MSYDYNKSTALIIGMTDTDEKVTAAAGRVSTQEGTALSIWDKSQDKDKNTNFKRGEVSVISADDSKVKIYVIPTDEELMIAKDTARLVK